MKKSFTLCWLLFAGIQFLFAQDAHVKGTITDIETKEPLTGATVKIDKIKGALSDASGQFTLTVPAGEHDISISFVGYKSDKRHITLAAGETLKLDVPLNSSALQMAQVETVSQYGKNSAQETVTTEVITRAEIQNTNSQNIGDVVSKVPGVLVQDGQITIRGMSSYSYGVGTRTALLVDGMSLSSPDLQQTQNNFVPLENAKQVEVVKGASSVIYGSNALDGVVNVISEWPTDNDPKTEIEANLGVYSAPKLSYQKWWSTAPPAFGSINVNHQRRFKHVQFIIGGNITANNSYVQWNGEYRARMFFRLRYIHPKIAGLSMGVSGSFMVDRIDQFFISKDLDSNAFIPADYSSSSYELTTLDPFVTYATLKGHQYKLQVRYMNIFRDGGTSPNAVSHYIEVNNQYQYKFLKNLFVVTAGMPFDVGVDRSNLYPGLHDNYNWAVYAQGELNYKILSLQAGLRYELAGVDSYFIKSKPVFRSGVNIHAAAATWFRASWGQGYRIPSVAEKYLADNFTSGIVIIPNDTLKAESSWSLELGFRQGFLIKKNWKLFVDAAFFWQQFHNYIEYIVGFYPNINSHGQPYVPDSLEFDYPNGHELLGPKPFNVLTARVAGYEISLSSDGKVGPVGIRMMAGYTYNYPHTIGGAENAGYTTGDYIHDLFYYNFHRVPNTGHNDSTLLPLAVRHLVHADIELSYWKMILGTTISYYSTAEAVPQLFELVASEIMHNGAALDNYLALHQHGDATGDIRIGYKHNEHFYVGFIIKNIANRFYELRPGLPEPTRNYTVQFRYSF